MTYVCSICEARFSDTDSLQEHEQLHRQLESLSQDIATAYNSPSPSGTLPRTSPGLVSVGQDSPCTLGTTNGVQSNNGSSPEHSECSSAPSNVSNRSPGSISQSSSGLVSLDQRSLDVPSVSETSPGIRTVKVSDEYYDSKRGTDEVESKKNADTHYLCPGVDFFPILSPNDVVVPPEDTAESNETDDKSGDIGREDDSRGKTDAFVDSVCLEQGADVPNDVVMECDSGSPQHCTSPLPPATCSQENDPPEYTPEEFISRSTTPPGPNCVLPIVPIVKLEPDDLPPPFITQQTITLDHILNTRPPNTFKRKRKRKKKVNDKLPVVGRRSSVSGTRASPRRGAYKIYTEEPQIDETLYPASFLQGTQSHSNEKETEHDKLVKRAAKLDEALLCKIVSMNRRMLVKLMEMETGLLRKLTSLEPDMMTKLMSLDKKILEMVVAKEPDDLINLLNGVTLPVDKAPVRRSKHEETPRMMGSRATKQRKTPAHPVVILNRVASTSPVKLTPRLLRSLTVSRSNSPAVTVQDCTTDLVKPQVTRPVTRTRSGGKTSTSPPLQFIYNGKQLVPVHKTTTPVKTTKTRGKVDILPKRSNRFDANEKKFEAEKSMPSSRRSSRKRRRNMKYSPVTKIAKYEEKSINDVKEVADAWDSDNADMDIPDDVESNPAIDDGQSTLKQNPGGNTGDNLQPNGDALLLGPTNHTSVPEDASIPSVVTALARKQQGRRKRKSRKGGKRQKKRPDITELSQVNGENNETVEEQPLQLVGTLTMLEEVKVEEFEGPSKPESEEVKNETSIRVARRPGRPRGSLGMYVRPNYPNKRTREECLWQGDEQEMNAKRRPRTCTVNASYIYEDPLADLEDDKITRRINPNSVKVEINDEHSVGEAPDDQLKYEIHQNSDTDEDGDNDQKNVKTEMVNGDVEANEEALTLQLEESADENTETNEDQAEEKGDDDFVPESVPTDEELVNAPLLTDTHVKREVTDSCGVRSGKREPKMTRHFSLKCRNCDDVFDTYTAIEIHRRSECDGFIKKFRCECCGYEFDNRLDLVRHKLRLHICMVCGEAYNRTADLKTHMFTHQEPYQCRMCDSAFSTAVQLTHHAVKHKIYGGLVCCGETFIAITKLQAHCSVQHDDKYQPVECEICGDWFPMMDILVQHSKFHKNKKALPKPKPKLDEPIPEPESSSVTYTCGECEEKFTDLIHHLQYSTQHYEATHKYQCQICEQRFDIEKMYKRHILSKHYSGHLLQCPHCSEKFRLRSVLENHLKTDHSELVEAPLQCPHCPQSFVVFEDYLPHFLTHIPTENYSCRVCDETLHDVPAYNQHMQKHRNATTCTQCTLTFKTRIQFENHVRKYHRQAAAKLPRRRENEESIICDQCGCTASRHGIKQHILRCHTEKTLKCPKCDKMFAAQNLLNQHLTTHDETRNVMCAKCGAMFRRTSDLNVHDQRAHRPKGFKCETCGKMFARDHNLQNHRKAIHLGGLARRYNCNFCSKKFTNMSVLQRHKRRHTGEKPFKCDYCDKRFAVKNCLNYHMKEHGKLPYRCPVCTQSFAYPSQVKYHMSTHTGEYEHNCELCGQGFTFKTHLRAHKLKAHGISEMVPIPLSDGT